MKQTNGVTTVISQEQSDLVTSATNGQQKEPIKNGKSVIITNNNNNNSTNNINKTKITLTNNHNNNNNNNNSTITNKNKSATHNKPNVKQRINSDMICTTKSNGASQISSASSQTVTTSQTTASVNGSVKINPSDSSLPDVRAKQVLKEAVDAVVNSFTKHTQGYGRGELTSVNLNTIHFCMMASSNIKHMQYCNIYAISVVEHANEILKGRHQF